LSEYNGTLLFVSHDRYFIDALASQVWAVNEGSLRAHLGNYTEYLNWESKVKQREEEARREISKIQPGGAKAQISNSQNGSSPKASPNGNSHHTNGKGNASNGSNGNGVKAAVAYKDLPKEEKARRKKLSELEVTIANQEKRLNQLSEDMTQATNKQDVNSITRLGQEYQQAADALEKLYADWGVLAG